MRPSCLWRHVPQAHSPAVYFEYIGTGVTQQSIREGGHSVHCWTKLDQLIPLLWFHSINCAQILSYSSSIVNLMTEQFLPIFISLYIFWDLGIVSMTTIYYPSLIALEQIVRWGMEWWKQQLRLWGDRWRQHRELRMMESDRKERGNMEPNT